VIELDVDSDKSVEDAIDRINDESKRIDVLVNNAGYALVGALEDLSMDEIKAQFETNLFGAIRVMKAVLPIMRKQQGGTIVNISSSSVATLNYSVLLITKIIHVPEAVYDGCCRILLLKS
jgi:NADP-dependent 3-hydroxy acid dehydrogenase YdfG